MKLSKLILKKTCFLRKLDLIILSRIDTTHDFDLVSIFKNLYINGAKNIYFIPAEKLTFKTILVKNQNNSKMYF